MLSSRDLLELWEAGLDRQPPARGTSILRAAALQRIEVDLAPEADPSRLPLGVRDYYLLGLREHAFGSQLSGQAACPRCGEQVELAFAINDVRIATAPIPAQLELERSGYCVRFRLPDSRDLEDSSLLEDDGVGLLERCVLEVSHNDAAISASALPEEIRDAISEEMARADPQAEIELALDCPSCGEHWQQLFDIESFFWRELESSAARLLREVHQLASAYGWSEREILAMPALRRHVYLNLIVE